MLAPNNESYIVKAYRMLAFSILGAVQAFVLGMFTVLSVSPNNHRNFAHFAMTAIAVAVAMVITGWVFQRDFTRIVSRLREEQRRSTNAILD
jgi:heme/copper-type cytochrome/quinol oxidase subunit 4